MSDFSRINFPVLAGPNQADHRRSGPGRSIITVRLDHRVRKEAFCPVGSVRYATLSVEKHTKTASFFDMPKNQKNQNVLKSDVLRGIIPTKRGIIPTISVDLLKCLSEN
ncbi:hypothetical protein ES705_11438 [subsurface metagenome]